MSKTFETPRALRLLLGTALACLSATPVLAQTQAQQSEHSAGERLSEETIVVSGRRTVAPALADIRREEDAIVDSLTFEQIEQLPDTNLAQTLDRIVGVSSDRGFGASEGRTVTLRGFDARYNSMSVDGNPIWNSSRNNRGAQLDVFPSSVVGQVDVFKTVTPDMDANSIGGHVAMRTLRAFDGGDQPYFRARASYGYYEHNDTPDNSNPSYRIDAGGKFTFGPGHNYGVVAGVDYQTHDFHDLVSEVTGYAQSGGRDLLNGDGYRGVFQRQTETLSGYAKFEMRATDQLYAFASVAYFQDQRDEYWDRMGVYSASNRVTNAGDGTGDFTGATAETYVEGYNLDRTTLQYAAGLDYRLGGRSALSIRASFLNYDHDESEFRSEKFQLSGLSGSYDITGETPYFTLAPNANLSNPALWRYRVGSNRTAWEALLPHEDDVTHLRVDYKFNSQHDSQGFGFETGAYWRRLDRDHDRTTNLWYLPSGTVFSLANVNDPANGASGPNGVTPFFIDLDALRAYLQAHGVASQTADATSDYTLVEDVSALYGAAIWDFGQLRLQAGLRVESTNVDNTTASTRSGVLAPDARHMNYTNTLPNFQASYDVADDLRLRFAATRTLARPDFSDFAFGQTITFDGNGAPVINGANPDLGPRISDNLDASFDWYVGDGFLSIGVFRKSLKDETFTEKRVTRDGNGQIILTETMPLNTGGAEVNGFEVSFVQEHFDFLPGPLSGLGFYGNYTQLDGEWNVVFSDGARQTVSGLRNQPEWLANANLTYKAGGFDMTLAYRMRGRAFTGDFGAVAASSADDVWIDNYNRLDLSANLDLGHGMRLTAQARNLNNAYWVEQTGIDGDSLYDSYNPGRTFWLGFSFKPDFDH